MTQKITTIPRLTPRPADAHKGDFGKVLIVGGSRGMIGAPSLTANAALRSGAGLVRVAIPETIQLTVAQLTPCATSIPLAEDEQGCLSHQALNDILNALEDNNVLALGPGLGQPNELAELVLAVVTQCDKPMVIDADGLNNLAAVGGKALELGSSAVLTPHPGEMQRLWRACLREEIPAQRTAQAEKLAQYTGSVIVLKGANTVVTDGQSTYINETGNPGMASGGTGDVLTGIIAALLARQGNGAMTTLEAAVLGVYIHGRAGDLAAAVMGQTSLIATDLLDWLVQAWETPD